MLNSFLQKHYLHIINEMKHCYFQYTVFNKLFAGNFHAFSLNWISILFSEKPPKLQCFYVKCRGLGYYFYAFLFFIPNHTLHVLRIFFIEIIA